MASIHDVLRPINFTKVVSRVSAASSQLLNSFGMQPGGPLEANYGHGREGSYNIFNNVRTVALGAAPGQPAARRERNQVGRVPFVYPRMHQQMTLLYEEIHNFAKIDDPRMRDIAGESYILRQMKKPAQEAANWRLALLVGMLRDALYVHEVGRNWYVDYTSTGASYQISYGQPAGNLSTLNMTDNAGSSIYGSAIIDTPWSNPAADIPLHCNRISAGLMRRHGVPLSDIYLRTEGWNYVIKNDHVLAGAGIANQPFKFDTRQTGTNPDGSPFMERVAELATVPGVTWHINDEGMNVGNPEASGVGYSEGGTWTYHIEAGKAFFMPPLGRDLFEMCVATEPICEYDGGPLTMKTGQSAWTHLTANPTAYNAFILDNAFPVPYSPGSWAYGTIYTP